MIWADGKWKKTALGRILPLGGNFSRGWRTTALLLFCAATVSLSGCMTIGTDNSSSGTEDPYKYYMDKPVKSVSEWLFQSAALPQEELGEPVEDQSALTLYYSFLRNLKSGKVKKTQYSAKSLYDVVSYTTEDIVFTTRPDGKLIMTYRQRQPIVFWYYPETDYYDGDYYYYKHNGDWFVDTFNRRAKQVELDALGIAPDVITQYRITDSKVFRRPDEGFQVYVYAEFLTDREKTAQVIGVMDKEGIFSYIEATVVYPDIEADEPANSEDGHLKITEKYIIEYSKINEVVEVEPPATLTKEEIEYLQQEYQNAQKQRGTDQGGNAK